MTIEQQSTTSPRPGPAAGSPRSVVLSSRDARRCEWLIATLERAGVSVQVSEGAAAETLHPSGSVSNRAHTPLRRDRGAAASDDPGELLVQLVVSDGPASLGETDGGASPGVRTAAGALSALVGNSSAHQTVRKRIALLATRDDVVLVSGETGTGKQCVAEALHEGSRYAGGAMVRVCCASVSEATLEAELFGVEGSQESLSTRSAKGPAPSAFERAEGGTLVLDEVSELPLALQSRLVRALRERRYVRLGGAQSHPIGARVVATSSRDLRSMVTAGAFREELFLELSACDIELAPLRARREDVAPIAEQYLTRRCAELGREAVTLTPEAARLLTRYDWPGNVRELENVLERALMLSGERDITAAALPARLTPSTPPRKAIDVPGATFAEIERHAILATYEACGHNVTRTAQVLALSPRTIHYRLREYRGERGRRRPRELRSAV